MTQPSQNFDLAGGPSPFSVSYPTSFPVTIDLSGNTLVTADKVSYSGPPLSIDPFPSGVIATTTTNTLLIPINSNLSEGLHELRYTLTGNNEILPSTRLESVLYLLVTASSITIDLNTPNPLPISLPFLPPNSPLSVTFTDSRLSFDQPSGSVEVLNFTGFTSPFSGSTPYQFSPVTSSNTSLGFLPINIISSTPPTLVTQGNSPSQVNYFYGLTENSSFIPSTAINVNLNGNNPNSLFFTMILPSGLNSSGIMTTFEPVDSSTSKLIITIDNSNDTGVYLNIPYVLSGNLGTTNGVINAIILRNDPVDYSNPDVTQTYPLIPNTPQNSTIEITWSTLLVNPPPGISFLNNGKDISIDKNLHTEGIENYAWPYDFIAIDTSDSNIIFRGSWSKGLIPSTPPSISLPPFVGGIFSMEQCIILKGGNIQKTIITGTALSRDTLIRHFYSLLSNIVRSRGLENYKDPNMTSILDIDNHFSTPTRTGLPYLSLRSISIVYMIYFPPNIIEIPSEVKIISDTVNTYFKIMVEFIAKFYGNSSIVSSDCLNKDDFRPAFTTSASDCYSSLKLSMSSI